MTDSFRLIQDGQPVAWAEGRNAFAEITHYAAVYGQDGPVTIQMKVNGRWVTGRKLEQRASLEARVRAMTNDKDSAVREAAIEECAKALEDDAKQCDCFARNEGECGCGAWCEWKSITSARAVEIVRSLVKGTPFS